MSSAVKKLEFFRGKKELDSLRAAGVTDEKIQEISDFFVKYETQSSNFTHINYNGAVDWHTANIGRYNFPDTVEVQNQLREYVGLMYSGKSPLTLNEVGLPSCFPLCIDIDVSISTGNENDMNSLKESIIDANRGYRLFNFINSYVFERFPQIGDKLDVVIYDASGFSRDLDVFKVSLHLRYQKIYVSRESEQNFRTSLVNHLFQAKCHDKPREHDQYIEDIYRKLRNASPKNEWRNVFDESVAISDHGLRLGLCDKKSAPPTSAVEGRPLAPHSILRTTRGRGTTQVTSADASNVSLAQWVELSSVRHPGKKACVYTPSGFERPNRITKSGGDGSLFDANAAVSQSRFGAKARAAMSASQGSSEEDNKVEYKWETGKSFEDFKSLLTSNQGNFSKINDNIFEWVFEEVSAKFTYNNITGIITVETKKTGIMTTLCNLVERCGVTRITASMAIPTGAGTNPFESTAATSISYMTTGLNPDL